MAYKDQKVGFENPHPSSKEIGNAIINFLKDLYVSKK